MNPDYPTNPEYQMGPQYSPGLNLPPKKYIVLALVAILALIVAVPLRSRLTTTSVEVTTNDPSSVISVQQTSPKYKTIDTKNAKGSFSARLARGTYTITAKDGYASAQQIVTVAGTATKVNINVNTQANEEGVLENITDRGAYSTVADAGSVRFIDRNHSPARLYQIDASNTLTALAPSVSFDSIAWADPSFGVGQSGNKLLAITKTAVTGLTIPVAASTYTVAPNHDVYLSDGSSLYRGAGGTNFTKVFSADPGTQITVLSASNDTAFLTSKATDSNREGELITLHKDGSKQEADGEVYEGVWSKAGSYLALTGDTSGIFNNKLQRVTNLPINNVTALAWTSDDSLIYADNNLIWQFTASSHDSSVLATTPSGVGTISQLAPSSDGSSIYISIQNSDISNGYSFYLARYKFKGTPTTDPLYQKITTALPNATAPGCQAGYVNFTKLAVTVASSPLSQQSCLAATKSYLQSYDINPNSVNYQSIAQ